MFSIENKKPNTFFSSEKDLKIFDEKKNVFYFHPNKEQAITFNLPKGKYYTFNKIRQKEIFMPYNYFHPPFPNGFIKKIKIQVKPNVNKASIFRHELRIVIDPKIVYHKYKPVAVFTTSHELGHFFHFPEKNKNVSAEQIEMGADKFAVDYMLGNGYNPSQIKIAKDILLSSPNRKQCLEELTFSEKNNYRR